MSRGAGGFDRRQFAFGLGLVDDADAPAATLGQLRGGGDRRLGAAEMVDQFAEGDRADVLAADQA